MAEQVKEPKHDTLLKPDPDRPFLYECWNSRCKARRREARYRKQVACRVCAGKGDVYNMRYLGAD